MARESTTSRRRAATLRDVALLAGVSQATASKALNGKDEVSAKTRRRVEDAAAEIGFTLNTLAQSVSSGRSGTVGLITNDLNGRFSLPILMGAEDAFGAGQMSVFLCDGREDAIREQHHLRSLLGRRVDGIIVVGARTEPRPPLGENLPVPVVYAYSPSLDPNDASVIVDNLNAGVISAEHLLSLGRRRIAHITGDPTYAAARDRAAGIESALAEANLSLVGPVRYGAWTEAWGRAATAALFASREATDVDAIICGSDQIARGVLDMTRDLGVSVPEQVAITSFDNWEPIIEGCRPELTSVDMEFERIGRRAAQRLFAALDGQDEPGIESIEPRLIVRASSGGK